MLVKFTLSIGFHGAKNEDENEYPDDTTDEQLDADWQDWCANYINGGWVKVEQLKGK